MTHKTLQDILPLVGQPSRYLGTEVNRIRKDIGTVKLTVALAFPDSYEIGTSHFGLQILYHVLNSRSDIAAERVFSPAPDLEEQLRAAGIPLSSLESGKPLGTFDLLGFSMLYELNYTNILNILDLAQIPFFSAERKGGHPLVIGGGPCTCNPEPVADFFDAIVFGDGEEVVIKMADAWIAWKETASDRERLLSAWSQIEGVYVPSFFEIGINPSGFQTLTPKHSDYTVVKRTLVADLDAAPFPTSPVVPFGKPVHDRLRMELSRGCSRGCRYCQAGMIYRPVRERSMETILRLLEQAIDSTGYEDISLLSLSTGDYGCLVPLMQEMMTRFEDRNVAVSFPSVRADTLTRQLMKLIQRVRKTGFTIAPEAGSQRLRDAINKNLTEVEILRTIEDAFRLGWQTIKLYFMVGLPTETEADIDAIVDLVQKVKRIKIPGSRRGILNVGVATFIPKPHTPFQWESQISLAESREKIKRLQQRLTGPGIQMKWQNPETSVIEGLWARGDRRLSRLLVEAFRRGCRFDGWSDRFRFDLWKEAVDAVGGDIDLFTTRRRDVDEPLPWDHMDARVDKDFLKEERKKAYEGRCTGDCRTNPCSGCGACDFDVIKPVLSRAEPRETDLPESGASLPVNYKALIVAFEKTGNARFLGHLEMVNLFARAIRRARIPVRISAGFHPIPKISFADALPIGLESLEEFLFLSVPEGYPEARVLEALKAELPEGLSAVSCRQKGAESEADASSHDTYLVELKDGFFEEKELECFRDSPALLLERVNRKGITKKTDLKKLVAEIGIESPTRLHLGLKEDEGRRIRPAEALLSIFNLPPERRKQARIIKMPRNR
jgi:radical SAM family uncharacterized protein/radical SAM-linked protein